MERQTKGGNFSFLIVGAGPAGLISGICLARLGHSVTLIEKEEGPHQPVCGEYLSPQGIAYLKNIGLYNTLEGFQKILGMQLVSPAGRKVLAGFPEGQFGASLNRKEFQIRLASVYLEIGGRLVYGEKLESLQDFSNICEVKTNHSRYRVDGIIGADGRTSLVAKLSGLDADNLQNHRVAVHTYLRAKKPLGSFGQMHILPDGSYVGLNPINSWDINFSIVTDAQKVKEKGGPKKFLNYHLCQRPQLQELFEPIQDEKIKTTFPINCQRETANKGRVALVGDASGFIDPLTGEGITTAIKTAVILAKKVATASNLPNAFSDYANSRNVEFQEKERLNRLLQKVILRPLLCEGIALVLGASKNLRSVFIGVIGNIYSPKQAAKILIFKWNQKRRQEHVQNNRSPVCISKESIHPEGSGQSAEDDLARTYGSARKA